MAEVRIKPGVRPYGGRRFELVRREDDTAVVNVDSKSGNSPMQFDLRVYRLDEVTPLDPDAEKILAMGVPPQEAAAPPMAWRDLPNGAKNLLEWLEGPHTDKLHTLEIVVGQVERVSRVLVTEEIFSAAKAYVEGHARDFELREIGTDRMRLKLAASAAVGA